MGFMTASFQRQGSLVVRRGGIGYLIYGLALLKFFLPFLLQHSVYEPHRDEFLYLAEGRHLAFGYPDSPPLPAVFAALSNLLGGGFFWIKFWPALFGAMTYVLVARMILLLGGARWASMQGGVQCALARSGPRWAVVLGFLPFVIGPLLPVNFLLKPDFLGLYFETLMVYGVLRAIRTKRVGGLYWVGIGFGLGMLSQYHVLLFALGLIVVLAFSKDRQLLMTRHFYFALLLGLLLFLPNLIWQAGHGWPAMEPAEEWQLRLGWMVMPWGIAFGAVWVEQKVKRKFWRYGMVGISVVAGCFVDMASIPMLPPAELAAFFAKAPVFRQLGLMRWEDGRDHALPQEFADMLGWEEMTMKAARAYESLDSLGKTEVTLGGGSNDGESGALDYFGPKYGLPPVEHRGDREMFIFATNERSWMNGKKFVYAVVTDSVTHPFAREYGSYILLLKGPNAAARQKLLQGVERVAAVPQDNVAGNGGARLHGRQSLAGK